MNKKYISVGLMLAVSVAIAKPVQSELPVNISVSKVKTKAKETEVKNFNAVAAGGPLQVIITLGNTESIRFEGDEEAIATLVTEVKGNALIIRPQMSWTSWSHKYKDKKIIAHVNAKTIKSLTMSGDGSITVKGTINNNSLTTTLSGSGSISANVDVQEYSGVVSGSGKLNISGETDEASLTISGSGVLSKKGALKVGSLSATISGSGSAYIHTNGEISALISGSGKVYYTGNADVKEKKFLGSGGVKKLD
ncbi:head GIN domain-containing protein [Pedobacter xixiisoli]|uniref:Auto-transporter adhesin, head GIN domain n=1 Tax=Pedobacter xixiisoli TaxID=1476464 RepID=A0A286A0I6_9SPHI|nr:head GIN domain-containing protein [Pedobacter xixiisoli]SOD15419.1 Putative auto-transporter adhesin, head GIN domain [Pedobacter xixiisoli]